MHVFYLHGFASSPASSKAERLAERLARHGLTLHRPDFNQPEFSTLTVTRMIEQVQGAIEALPPAPVALVGSSLGGFVALHVAAMREGDGARPIERLVLLAPALDFGGNRMRELGPEGLARWRATDRLDVYHFAFEKVMPLRYALFDDAGRYDALALEIRPPVLVFQGRRDPVVDPSMVERWARSRPNVRLHLVDDEHQLASSVPIILLETESFLGLAPRGGGAAGRAL